MKRKYKIKILITVCVISLIWGIAGTWIFLRYPENHITTSIVIYALYLLTLTIPVKQIAKNAREDAK